MSHNSSTVVPVNLLKIHVSTQQVILSLFKAINRRTIIHHPIFFHLKKQ